LLDRVKLYQAETPLFDEYDIEAEIRSLFKPRVELPTGGYLIIQPTEALTSIDVEHGPLHRQEGPREHHPEDQCRGGARVARQLRLRDIGGIIVVISSIWNRAAIGTRCCRNCAPIWDATGPRTKAFAVSELG